jgi:hypothetical protein
MKQLFATVMMVFSALLAGRKAFLRYQAAKIR